jgi:NodT family efflux transporter outer membrane factor (OMF) lipoprotein
MKSLPYFFTLGLLGLCFGCAVGPDYVRPEMEMAAQFKQQGIWQSAMPQEHALRDRWWEMYADPALSQLIDKVALNNQNIVLAQAQYQQARALIQDAQASFWPSLTANAAYGKSNPSAATVTEAKPYNVKLQAAWEIDLWGGIRRNVEAGKANAAASGANVEAVKLSTYLAVSQAYFQLRITDLQSEVAQRTVETYTKVLAVTRARYQSGADSQVALMTADNQLKSAQLALAELRVQRAKIEHAIAVLIGQSPSSFSLARLLNWQIAQPIFPVSVPSQLLERRPDIAVAERKVAAANAKIGVAQSAYFPALNITASGGYQGSGWRHLFDLPNRIWSLGASLALSVFDGEARQAQMRQAEAIYQQTVANYRQTVLTALQEVEDNLSTLNILSQALTEQEQIVHNTNQSLERVLNQYRAGITDYLSVATALASSQHSENARLLLLGRYYLAHVGLVAALGGSWHANAVNAAQK